MYNNKRNVHTSWSTDDGIYLISGYPSGRTSDIIKTDGTTQEGFKLRVDSRFTCSIPEDDDDTLIITGSWDKPTNRVDKYSKDGFLEALPSLNEGRRSHGCGSYVDSFNQRIYLVAGGFENYGEGFRSSTELLVKDGVAWTLYENSLPSRMYDVASVSLNNEIFLSGGKEGRSSREVYDSILQFQKKRKEIFLNWLNQTG